MANQAVKENNAVVVNQGEDEPTIGGNIAKYSEVSGEDKSGICCESTWPGSVGPSGLLFVTSHLIFDFEQPTALRQAEPATPEDYSPILDPEVKTLGISYLPHPKTENSTQILFCKE